MNRQTAINNELFRQNPIDIEAMMRVQRNNKRTFIDPQRLDMTRMMELTEMISHDNDLGMIIQPIPFREIENDTEATLNMVDFTPSRPRNWWTGCAARLTTIPTMSRIQPSRSVAVRAG